VLSVPRIAIAPLYLFACLILGGSAQGVWQNMALQLVGIAIIAWSVAAQAEDPLAPPARALLLLAIAVVAVVALQLVPLSPAIWAHGVRSRIAQEFTLLGRPAPPLPLSLTPYESLSTLFCLIPPLAIFCAISRLKAYRPSWLAFALLAGTVAGVLLGTLQVSSGGQESPWYLYPETNLGLAVGFFANANHMASLLVLCLPFVAALASDRSGTIQRRSALVTILAAILLLLVVGIALNGSLAGYTLAVPVIAASTLIVLPPGTRLRKLVAILGALSIVAAIGALASSSIGGTRIGQDATTSVQSREQILATTGKAIRDYMPFGSGLGSFIRVYRTYESPDTVSSEYVIHAHDDYAEIVLELGIPGIILLILFLAWWVVAVVTIWRTGRGGAYARAASVASAAVLIHSLVDFPLRTAAISTCFAMCLALMAEPRVPAPQGAGDLRPTRHVVIG
jgi:O-antigen ligase